MLALVQSEAYNGKRNVEREDIEMKVVSTEKAPAAIGPYSQAMVINGMVFTSGQIPLNPQTGKLQERALKSRPNR